MAFMIDAGWMEVLVGVLALIVAVIIYRLTKQKKSLSYEVLSQSPLITISGEIKGKLKLLYEDSPVENVHLLLVRFANSGNIPITSDDYTRPLTISFKEDTSILSAECVKSSPENLGVELKVENGRIEVAPLLMNGGDAFTAKLLLGQYSGSFDVDARIIGVSSIRGTRGTFIEEKRTPSRFQRLLNHPLFLMVIGFLLTSVIGGLLTSYYTLQQKEIESQRSFSDELNKARVQKIGEMWEEIDKTESTIDEILNKADRDPNSNKQVILDQILKLIAEETTTINKNRFWLGEHNYNYLINYLAINSQYVQDKLMGQPGIDLNDTIKKREQAKQDILQIRNSFLNAGSER
jgi:hypothetical protein